MNGSLRTDSGLSLLEIVVALGIFVTVCAALSDLLITSSDTYQTGMTIANLEGRGRRALDQIAGDLVASGATTFSPTPDLPFGSTTLTFQKSRGFDTGSDSILWGPTLSFDLIDEPSDPNDGLDNDDDGLVDERRLVRRLNSGLSTEVTVVLLTDVAPYLEGETPNGGDDNQNGLIDEEGLCFSLVGDQLTIQITLGGRDAHGRVLLRTVSTTVVVRN
ncbi:MAG: hypothetical protein CMJ83_13165 [Planctomycetes bacterium]|nr:hypothetical protein [Planctomycetota bacterium]